MATRPFNFNLPDTLRDFMELSSASRYGTMSQYIIGLINSDMERSFSSSGKRFGIQYIYEKKPEVVDSAIRFCINNFDESRFTHKVIAMPGCNVYEDLYKCVDDVFSASGKQAFSDILCHPALVKVMKPLAEKYGLSIIENSMDIMKTHVFLLTGARSNHAMAFSIIKSALMRKASEEEGEHFFSQELIDQFEPPVGEIQKPSNDTSKSKVRIREAHYADGLKKFYVQGDFGKNTKSSSMNTNADGTVSITYAEDWKDVKEFTSLEEAKRHMAELRGEKQKLVKEVIHV